MFLAQTPPSTISGSRTVGTVAIDILEALSKTTNANQYVVVTTDRYLELTRALLKCQIAIAIVTRIYLYKWIIPYEIQTNILGDNAMRFTSKFFATLCTHLGTKQLTTTAYQPQSNGRLSDTIKQSRHDFAIIFPINNASGTNTFSC